MFKIVGNPTKRLFTLNIYFYFASVVVSFLIFGIFYHRICIKSGKGKRFYNMKINIEL